MFIIVEGPDGAGKTTLIEKLKHQLDQDDHKCEVVHFGKIDNPDEYFDIYRKEIRKHFPDETVIFDRSWYSDRVYGPVMRNTIEMSKDQAQLLDLDVFTYGGGMIIYCDAPLEVLWARCRERGETYIETPEQLDALKMMYQLIMKEATLPVVYYDTHMGY